MNGTSSKPAVVTYSTRAPRRCSSALVPTVVPTVSASIASDVQPEALIAASTARHGLSGVDGTLAMRVAPLAGSIATRSVNVPPVSTPMWKPMSASSFDRQNDVRHGGDASTRGLACNRPSYVITVVRT